ncbi:MAG: isoamylase early set domain-containing protein [Gemmatimonadales bacterium]
MSDLNRDVPEALDPVLAKAAAALRVTRTLGPDFEDRVMAAVRLTEPPVAVERRRRVFGIGQWATRSHTVELPRLKGLAIAAGLAALLASGVWIGRQSVTPASTLPAAIAATASQTAREVEFVLLAPGASQVTLVGDFNGWSPGATPLRASERRGIWSVTVPLTPGRHEYAFLVDGKHWLPDPLAPLAPSDDFGTPNSVLTVTERS